MVSRYLLKKVKLPLIQGRKDYKEQITKNAVEFEPVEL